MKQSTLFSKTTKQIPKDETSKNAQILLQGGFIHKEMAGAYAYLPLGIRVIENIKKIVREEMNAEGGHELIMTSLQRKDLWETTDRWSDENVDVWFKSELKNGTEIGFAWSHEEPITNMMKAHISSYKDLPAYVYQFQTKLRNELRAKSGILRGREFVMKDLYSYSLDAKQHDAFYDAMKAAYMRVFNRVGIGEDTFITFASGGAFTEFSHEFQTITEVGEDVTYISRDKNIAINEEVYNENTLKELGVSEDELEKVTTAEVGNIFNFGTHKCEQLGLFYTNADGEKVPVHLGSYGIGITRLMGVVAEKNITDGALIWPESISPFKVHLISLCKDDQSEKIDAVYKKLVNAGINVLYDDRDARAGEKLNDADLIGIPHRIVIGNKSLEKNECEYTSRAHSSETKNLSLDTIVETLSA